MGGADVSTSFLLLLTLSVSIETVGFPYVIVGLDGESMHDDYVGE
jgi:hypothetical protein